MYILLLAYVDVEKFQDRSRQIVEMCRRSLQMFMVLRPVDKIRIMV